MQKKYCLLFIIVVDTLSTNSPDSGQWASNEPCFYHELASKMQQSILFSNSSLFRKKNKEYLVSSNPIQTKVFHVSNVFRHILLKKTSRVCDIWLHNYGAVNFVSYFLDHLQIALNQLNCKKVTYSINQASYTHMLKLHKAQCSMQYDFGPRLCF